MNHDPIVWYQWRYQMSNYMKLTWYELNFPQVCAQNDNVKIKCTIICLDQESLDHIMHGGSSKGYRNDKDINWNEF